MSTVGKPEDTHLADAHRTRGETMIDLLKDIMNIALIFGCSPSVGIPAQTKMMADIADTLLQGYGEEYTCTFPDVLDRL